MSLPEREETQAPPVRTAFLPGLATARRGPWELVATILIAIGVVMLMQPLSLALYGWSFATILAGTALFVVVSHFRE